MSSLHRVVKKVLTTESPALVAAAAGLQPIVNINTEDSSSNEVVPNESSNDTNNNSNSNSSDTLITSLQDNFNEEEPKSVDFSELSGVKVPEDELTLPTTLVDSFSEASSNTERKRVFQLGRLSAGSSIKPAQRCIVPLPSLSINCWATFCQLESVDSDDEVRQKCQQALGVMSQSIIRRDNIFEVLNILKDICDTYR